MATKKLYRSLLIAAFSAAALMTAACSDTEKHHTTLKKQMNDRWTATTVGVKYQLAQQQYAVGDYDKCRATINEAMVSGQTHPGLHILAAKVDIEKNTLDSAAEHLKEAMALAANDPEPYYLMGVVYQRWQRMESAMGYYQQAWDRKATDVRMMLAVVEMKITMGQLDDAQRLLDDKLGSFEQTAAVHMAMGRIASIKANYAAASKHYRNAFLLLPEDQNVKQSYAEALFFAGKYAEAAPMLDDIRNKLRPTEGDGMEAQITARVTVTQMLGQAYLNMRRPMDARSCFQEVVRYQPNNSQAILGLGKVCIETNELAAAIAAGRKVLKAEPQSVQAIILVAMAQQKQKKWADALSTLQSATSIAPKDSTVLCMAGVSVLKLGRSTEAVKYFERAVAANPRDTWATELLVQNKPLAATLEIVPSTSTPEATDAGPAVITTAQPMVSPIDGR